MIERSVVFLRTGEISVWVDTVSMGADIKAVCIDNSGLVRSYSINDIQVIKEPKGHD